MKETIKTVFEAWDGTLHDSRDKCLAYERSTIWRRLIGLTEAQVHAAMMGDDEGVAQAIITIGYRCAAVRKALAKKGPPPEPVEPPAPPPAESERFESEPEEAA